MDPTVIGGGRGASGEDGPATRARAFLEAVVWGRHTEVWDLLSSGGREAVLRVAVVNGLDRVVAGRLRDGLADPADRQIFLGRLLEGLRRDLRSVELDRLGLAGRFERLDDGTVRIELVGPSTIPGTGPWSAGHLVLVHDGERGWRVERLEPRLVTP